MDGNIQRGRGVCVRGGRRGGRERPRTVIKDEIWATIVHHVLVHGMTMREAGQRVQPNLSRFSVAGIIRTFREDNRIERQPHEGGRPSMFSQQQERLIVDMVLQHNAIRLWDIQQRVIEDHINSDGINSVSLSTIDRVLQRNRLSMKQVYRVPFERNSASVKDLRYQYVQRVIELDSMERPHEYIFIDETGFNLEKRRQRGRNITGQHAIVEVPGQRGGNVTLCAAISNWGVLHHHANLEPYNTEHLLAFLGGLQNVMTEHEQQNQQEVHPIYVIVWDNVRFHHAVLICEWFTNNQCFIKVFLPPYSPFLNPIEEFFSAWW
ncbi:uncharacterized protein LOC127537617 [Acanthochromis polyacanthus]|uniref:uncharacterized protein LOC127537617 n=1 Tax=Acanthochromis polyacanthus TaxID=80966 RepID=UPI0022348E3B|nr:uncharacterized protein LOC127537617 [Acanthochromis polyacanthus]